MEELYSSMLMNALFCKKNRAGNVAERIFVIFSFPSFSSALAWKLFIEEMTAGYLGRLREESGKSCTLF